MMSQCRPVVYRTQRPADIVAACGATPDVLHAMIKAEQSGIAMIGDSELAFMAYANDATHYDASTAIYSLTVSGG